ncbi:MAG: inositol monophosphatase family protein [Microthrixaceae bacterium]
MGELEEVAIDACRTAAKRIRSSESQTPVASKSTATDVVTEADLAAERIICDLLAEATPGARVLGEEGGNGVLGDGPNNAIEWVVDPLDGTVNFTYGVPISAVSVAAIVNGRPAAGAVVDVRLGEVFSAHAGGGARLDERPIGCTAPDRLDLTLVGTGFSYDANLRNSHGRTIAHLLGKVRDVRVFGSAALNLCWVAAGRLDAYVERDIKPWDYAAGSLIAREAHAQVELPCPENSDLVLAAGPAVFEQLRPLVG